MKNKIISLIAAVSLAVCGASFTAFGKDEGISLIYDGQEVVFDVQPQMYGDRVMVPVRAVFEMFGAKVKWDDETQTVTAKKKSKTITMTLNSNEITKNDETYTFDTAPIMVDDRILVPIRAVSEVLGLDVQWDDSSDTVVITTPDDEDNTWKENVGAIDLSSLNVSGSGVSVSGNVVTISEGGDFTVTGTLEDGQIVIDTDDKVKLRLSGMSLTNTGGAAIYVKNADKAYITLTEGTENYLSDGETYTTEDEKEKACITSRDNLEIKGNGSLIIQGNYNHGIDGSDSVEIENGNITITAKNDGIHVNDTLAISGGTVTVTAEGDGLQADEIVDISGGTVNVTTTGEMPAETTAFGGMNFRPDQNATAEERQALREEMMKQYEAAQAAELETDNSDDVTSKGIKADWLLEISGGSVTVNSTDHAVHCKSDINISGGDISLASESKKGISAHGNVVFDGGDITITKSTEGIESKQILTINGGNFNITASDDGLNAGGNGMDDMFGMGGRGQMNAADIQSEQQMPSGEQMFSPDMQGGQQAQGSQFGGRGQMTPPDMQNGQQPLNEQFGGGFGRGQETNEISSEHHIQINGGNLYINAQGDGIDSNGSLVIDEGTVIVDGPSMSGNSALDSDGAIMVNGGTLIAVGEAGMVEAPNSYSSRNVLNMTLTAEAAAGTVIEVKSADGTVIMSHTAAKSCRSIIFSSPDLVTGGEYTLYVGGAAQESFNVTDTVTQVGTAAGGFGGRGGMGNKNRGEYYDAANQN